MGLVIPSANLQPNTPSPCKDTHTDMPNARMLSGGIQTVQRKQTNQAGERSAPEVANATPFGQVSAKNSTVAVSVDREAIRLSLQNDAEFFIQFFLGDELTLPVPDFHVENFNLMTHDLVKQLCIAIPRDHAKTTLAKLTCVYYFMFHDMVDFILYLSNTLGIAKEAANDVWSFLNCDNFVNVFGKCTWETEQHGNGYYKFKLPDSLSAKRCYLKSLGTGMQVRGINVGNQRPKLAICDDIEDPDQIATEAGFMKVKRWFYGPFKKCLNKLGHKIIMIGNIVEQVTLVEQHCKSPFWHSRLMGCLQDDGTPLWKDAWPLGKLQQDYKEYQEAGMADIWFAEMMNMPQLGGSGLIKASEIKYLAPLVPNENCLGFMTVDLAISDQEWAHKTVITVHIFNEDEDCWQIASYYVYHGIDPIALFFEIVKYMAYWHLSTCGIESVAYQASLQTIYPHLATLHQVPNLTFVPIPRSKQKYQYLMTFAGMLRKNEYALTSGDFGMTQQLLKYKPKTALRLVGKGKTTQEDDIVDSGAMGPQMISMYLFDIIKRTDELRQKRLHGEALSREHDEGLLQNNSYAVCDC